VFRDVEDEWVTNREFNSTLGKPIWVQNRLQALEVWQLGTINGTSMSNHVAKTRPYDAPTLLPAQLVPFGRSGCQVYWVSDAGHSNPILSASYLV
jgi:hypothetical protein